MKSKITIITVSYNCQENIENTIKSVLDLNHPKIEYIVIDGNSKDNTINIIQKYIDNIQYFISEPDKGIYDAMNKGISKSTGDWIFFLNAGDIFDNREILNSIPFEIYTKDIDVCAIIGDIKVDIDGKISLRNKRIPFYRNDKSFKNMGFSHQGVFVKTEYAKSLLFDLRYKLCADYNMMVSLNKLGLKFIETDKPICTIQGGIGASANNRDLQMKEEGMICGVDNTIAFHILFYYRKIKRIIKNAIYK